MLASLARMLAGDAGWRGCWLVRLAMMLVMLAGDDGEDAGDAGFAGEDAGAAGFAGENADEDAGEDAGW